MNNTDLNDTMNKKVEKILRTEEKEQEGLQQLHFRHFSNSEGCDMYSLPLLLLGVGVRVG